MKEPFRPRLGATKSITVTASNVTVLMPDCQGQTTIRVYNGDTQTVFITSGASTAVAATTTSIPIAPGAIEVLRFGPVASGPRYMAAIGTAANSRAIYFTPGDGI